MHQVFDVPGSVRLKDVSRPAQGETPAGRIHRLAAKAVVEGCVATRQDGADDRYTVTSGNSSGVVYAVDAAAGSCTCKATRPCKHFSIVALTLIAERDRLRDLADRGHVKSTADFHRLQDAERRAERLAPVSPSVSPLSETPTVSERPQTDAAWLADLARRIRADAAPARYPGTCAVSGRQFGRGAAIVEVGGRHGPNRWALAEAVVAGHAAAAVAA